jgi:hypothetical protein
VETGLSLQISDFTQEMDDESNGDVASRTTRRIAHIQCFLTGNGQPSPEVHPFPALPASALWSNKNFLLEADWQLLKLTVPDEASRN